MSAAPTAWDVRSLTPDLHDDFFSLFDGAFSDNPDWAGCYCEFYEDGCSDDEWDTEEPGFLARNRMARSEAIRAGTVRGLLAYDAGTPVGWLSAGPRDGYGNLRVYAQAVEADDPPTGAIMCFVIHPDHRGRGVASALLAAADDHFRALGLQQAEAYPRQPPRDGLTDAWSSTFYKGSREMFLKAGYRHHRDVDRWSVFRKQLG